MSVCVSVEYNSLSGVMSQVAIRQFSTSYRYIVVGFVVPIYNVCVLLSHESDEIGKLCAMVVDLDPAMAMRSHEAMAYTVLLVNATDCDDVMLRLSMRCEVIVVCEALIERESVPCDVKV